MEELSLVALDTDHIKQYVFATDKLKEIRGASSLLDHLNRHAMDQIASDPSFGAEKVYTNGGSGLFLIKTEAARAFALHIQQEYQKVTRGGASITFAIQDLPATVSDPWQDNLQETLSLLRYRLAEKKFSRLAERDESGEAIDAFDLRDCLVAPSHPFMRICDACGLRYAEGKDPHEPLDEVARNHFYCIVCLAKREEDRAIKNGIDEIVHQRKEGTGANHNAKSSIEKKLPFVWKKVNEKLLKTYRIPIDTERPGDFNEFRGMAGGKDYLAVIYADGNSMGQMLEKLSTLSQVKQRAEAIDEAIYEALGFAINQHLPVIPREGRTPPRFPFDLLLVGGDDLMMVTPAAKGLAVALAIARKFHESTKKSDPIGKGYTLSVGIVLAPIKYPFGLLYDLVEDTLKHAKKAGTKQSKPSLYGETLVNFMTITGSTSQSFEKVYADFHCRDEGATFYATLRPYTIEELEALQQAIREGRKQGLGRTKLHQVREAVLKMNLTTSVDEGLAVLRNWRSRQREFVTGHVYTFGGRYQERRYEIDQPGTLFPRVTFPWFADGPKTYRTPLLDFVELYDFVEQEGSDEN